MNTSRMLVVGACAIAAAFACRISTASPAATQNWVREYVSTNTTASASTTNAVKKATIMSAGSTATVMEALNVGGTNAVRNAVNVSINQASAVVGPILEGGF